ncbi:hypothetical protein [Guggenheimella bovis]
MERGSFTVELTVFMVIILLLVGTILILLDRSKAMLLSKDRDIVVYEEAFWEKIDEIRVEKLHKEKR